MTKFQEECDHAMAKIDESECWVCPFCDATGNMVTCMDCGDELMDCQVEGHVQSKHVKCRDCGQEGHQECK